MDGRLVIFDVDGTLTNTSAVDAECFGQAAVDVLGIDVGRIHWNSAPQVTGAGIVEWLVTTHRGRPPTEVEMLTFQRHLTQLLENRLAQDPGQFVPIPGSPQMVRRLLDEGWDVAIASGGWAACSHVKLRHAGISAELLLSSCDVSPERVEVFRNALRAATLRYGHAYERVVLVADGLWDKRVAEALGWTFVGVAGSDCDLHAAGVATVLSDFLDISVVLAVLNGSHAD